MMKNSKNEQIKFINFIIFILLFLCSCNNKNNHTFYYNLYNSNDSLSGFIIKKVENHKNIRKEIDSVISLDGLHEYTNVNNLIVNKERLDKISLKKGIKSKKPYLTVKSKKCVQYIPDNKLADFDYTKFCFLEITNLKINSKNYSNVYKFLKTTGTIDGVQAIVYLDEDFILLKEEYINGYTHDYRIERVDEINFVKD